MSTDPARARAGKIRVNPGQDLSANCSRFFIPTIYVNLDPANIPTVYAEKGHSATRAIVALLTALEQAFRLDIVSRKKIHGFWPSVWAWLEWLYTHCVDASASVLTVWASLLAWFRNHSKTRTSGEAYPGCSKCCCVGLGSTGS
ncbi:hypothetical protein B0H11DRAFT_2236766 [Mycena galericulata]|nr:hypothetical protein B0H11DRAFT_2236766 [Mycena galericulata]